MHSVKQTTNSYFLFGNMTASPRRFPLSTHNRKSRSLRPPQDKQIGIAPLTSSFTSRRCFSPSPTFESCGTPCPEKRDAAPHDKLECSVEDFQQQHPLDNDVFRTTAWLEPSSDDEELWTLKRASPVYGDDDEFYNHESPAKRIKISSLGWEDRFSDESPHPAKS